MPPITVNDDDDSLADERAVLEARDKGEALTTLPVDEDEQPAVVQAAADPEDQPAVANPPPDAPKPDAGAADEPTPVAEVAADQVQQYQTPQARDYAKERTDLRAEKLAIDKKWSDGDLSDEDRAAQVNALDDKIDTITREQVRAETIIDINRQNMIREQDAVLANIRAASKGIIDYSIKENGQTFDLMFDAVRLDPANKGHSFEQVANKAHELVCASRGLAAKAPAAAAAPTKAAAPAAPAARPAIPTTIQSMPNAAAAPVQNETLSAIDAADPDQAEALMGAMGAQQKTALLHSTMPANVGRRRH